MDLQFHAKIFIYKFEDHLMTKKSVNPSTCSHGRSLLYHSLSCLCHHAGLPLLRTFLGLRLSLATGSMVDLLPKKSLTYAPFPNHIWGRKSPDPRFMYRGIAWLRELMLSSIWRRACSLEVMKVFVDLASRCTSNHEIFNDLQNIQFHNQYNHNEFSWLVNHDFTYSIASFS